MRRTLLVLAGPMVMLAGGAAGEPLFRDVTASSGITFVHDNGAKGEKQCIEQMGSGVCLLDFDGDGRLDVYLVNSVGPNRLYRNLGGLKFRDVTLEAGVGDEGYGMGAVAADVDDDGDPDLHVTNFGANRLYRNDGRGRFHEVSREAGVDDPQWGTGAAFLDYDRDGRLDLFVTNYVVMAVPDTNVCRLDGRTRLYCPPRDYPRTEDLLFRNRGDGTFENVTAAAGVAGAFGRGLGVVAADFDRDGWTDVYVANDLDPNFLWRNRGDGTFEEIGLFSGTSHSEAGKEESGMGVACGDYDNDGWTDLFVTNFFDQTNTLYHNEGGQLFLDCTASAGVGAGSLPYVAWGTEFVDFDLDGRRDLFVANGHTESDAELADPTTTWKQRDFLYRNTGPHGFVDVTAEMAPILLEPQAGRGTAFGDLDDDGDPEILLVNQLGPPLLLENRLDGAAHWIGIDPVGTRSGRDGVGTVVEVHASDLVATAEARAGASYLSCNDPRLVFGLGDRATVDSVVVRWPRGGRNVLRTLPVDRYHRVTEPTADQRTTTILRGSEEPAIAGP